MEQLSFDLEEKKPFRPTPLSVRELNLYVKDLVDYGYLDSTNNKDIEDRLVKVSINKVTKVINKIKYVDICE